MLDCGVLTVLADVLKDPLTEELHVFILINFFFYVTFILYYAKKKNGCYDLLDIIHINYSSSTVETQSNLFIQPLLIITEVKNLFIFFILIIFLSLSFFKK